MMIAEVQHLVKRYPSFELSDVSFSLEGGKITGFVGRNGAGKTTTIKAMLNLIHLDGGSVSYFGKPLIGNETEIHGNGQLVSEKEDPGHCRYSKTVL